MGAELKAVIHTLTRVTNWYTHNHSGPRQPFRSSLSVQQSINFTPGRAPEGWPAWALGCRENGMAEGLWLRWGTLGLKRELPGRF